MYHVVQLMEGTAALTARGCRNERVRDAMPTQRGSVGPEAAQLIGAQVKHPVSPFIC